MMRMNYQPLSKEQVRKAIKFQSPQRPPLCAMLWHNQETLDFFGDDFTKLMRKYPDDVVAVHIGVHYRQSHKPVDPNYRWAYKGWTEPSDAAIDNCPIIKNWEQDLDKFIADMPDANRGDAFDDVMKAAAENPDRYILVNWGHYFHQRLCYIRGTENLLYDFYDSQNHLHRIMDELLAFYRVWAKRTADSGGSGVWAGDDLGMQTALFMSPEKFREIYKPYYKALADILHSNGLDFWVHTCGNIYDILEDIIECGVDVLHPIQAGCMDAVKTVENYGGRIAFWAGMDVQRLIPFESVENIDKEIKRYAEIFYSPSGGVIYGAGNSILPDAPFENVEVYAKALTEFCCSTIKGENL